MNTKLIAACACVGAGALVTLTSTVTAQAPTPIPNVWLQNTTPGTMQTGHGHISGTFGSQDLFIRNELRGVISGLTQYSLRVNSAGTGYVAVNSLPAGYFSLVQGTSSADGSGFIELYSRNTFPGTVLLDADYDNTNNGVEQGALVLGSTGTGGPGGLIRLQSNAGIETVRITGGSTFNGLFQMIQGNGVPVVEATSATEGGKLTTLSENYVIQSALEPGADGVGGLFYLARGNSLAGLIIDGNNAGSMNTSMDILGTNPMTFNSNVGGNGSVVIPTDAIASSEMFDEPGVANIYTTSIAIGAAIAPITSRTITVPADGYVVAFAQAELIITHTTGTASGTSHGVSMSSTTLPTNQDVGVAIPAGPPSGVYNSSASAHGLFQVSAGTHTF